MKNQNSSALYWFRPSPFPQIIKISILCGLCMVFGVVTVGAGLDGSGRVEKELQSFLLLLGMGIVLSSVFSACMGYYKILMKDSTLLTLTPKGIFFTTPTENISIFWQDINAIEEQHRTLIFQTDSEQILIPSSFFRYIPTPALPAHQRPS